jgi:hypothetical protein
MLLTKNKLIAFVVFLWSASQLSCTRKWDDHNKINDEDLTQNLYQKIAADPSLSKFAGYLQKTGYADTLQLNRSFTVWAPGNDALQAIDATIGNDDKKLKQFVAHHIAHLSYYSDQLQAGAQRLPLVDGKYVIVKPTSFEDAPINSKDRLASNGVLNTITAAAAPVPNCWEYIDSLKAGGNGMARFLRDFARYKRDTTNAVQTGIDPTTGAPIYKPGTDTIKIPVFLDSVYNVNNEAKEYTVFIMNNTTWDKERAKLDTFFKTSTVDSTLAWSRFCTARDMAIEGAYAPDQLPNQILSKFGAIVPINRSAIQATYRTSNGYIYVMGDMNVPVSQRIRPFVIQGETYLNTSNGSRTPVYLRTLINPNNGQTFSDLYAYNHGVNKWNVHYQIHDVFTTKYRVYWATYNNRWNNVLNQRLAMGTADNATFPYRAVPYNVYNEEYVGDYTVTGYTNGYLDLYLVSADIAPSSSNQNQNSLFLDYIRLEPVVQ